MRLNRIAVTLAATAAVGIGLAGTAAASPWYDDSADAPTSPIPPNSVIDIAPFPPSSVAVPAPPSDDAEPPEPFPADLPVEVSVDGDLQPLSEFCRSAEDEVRLLAEDGTAFELTDLQPGTDEDDPADVAELLAYDGSGVVATGSLDEVGRMVGSDGTSLDDVTYLGVVTAADGAEAEVQVDLELDLLAACEGGE